MTTLFMNLTDIRSILGIEINYNTYAEIFNETDCDNDFTVSSTEFEMAINGEFCDGQITHRGLEKWWKTVKKFVIKFVRIFVCEDTIGVGVTIPLYTYLKSNILTTTEVPTVTVSTTIPPSVQTTTVVTTTVQTTTEPTTTVQTTTVVTSTADPTTTETTTVQTTTEEPTTTVQTSTVVTSTVQATTTSDSSDCEIVDFEADDNGNCFLVVTSKLNWSKVNIKVMRVRINTFCDPFIKKILEN